TSQNGQTEVAEGRELSCFLIAATVIAAFALLFVGVVATLRHHLTASIETVLARSVAGPCIRSALDSCESDSDCQVGGCGAELCYNPDQSNGFTTCDCGPPKHVTCGCVTGKCTWWQ